MRRLLQKLRDLDLGARIAVDAGTAIQIAGCLSRDEPVERGVRYRLRTGESEESTLRLAWADDALEIQIHGRERWRRLRAQVELDEEGRASAPSLAARIHPDRDGARELEHFMRRVVRAAWG